MKKYLLVVAGALLAVSSVQAVEHSLRELLPGLEMVYARSKDPETLPDIIKKYYAQAQGKDYKIPFADFHALYDAICDIQCKGIKTQI